MAPLARLNSILSHLTSGSSPQAQDAKHIRPAMPLDQPVNYSPLNPLSFLLRSERIRGDLHTAVEYKDLKWGWSTWTHRVLSLAYFIKSTSGVRPGDRILLLAPNTPFFLDVLHASLALGTIIVPVNTRLTKDEVRYIVDKVQPVVVCVDSEFVGSLDEAELGFGAGAKGLKRKTDAWIVSQDNYSPSDSYEVVLKRGEELVRQEGGDAKAWGKLVFNPDETAVMAISFTSGTTSRPKGVESTYRGTYLSGLTNAVESRIVSESRYLWTLPLFHIMGWTYPFACTSAMATQVCLRSVDNDIIWTYLAGPPGRGITHYTGAPTVQLGIISHPKAKKLDRPVRTTVAGAAPTPTLIKGLEEIGITVTHVYGLTETYGPMTSTYFPKAETKDELYALMARQGASFLVADDIQVVKIPKDGEKEYDVLQEVEWDGKELGEIVMRGNMVMRGYYEDAEATKKAFQGGFFHSGDLAVRYPDGTFMIQDRGKDIIISGGENVSSLFVEASLTKHPDVLEVAVVARPHEKWGERPHAFVVLKNSVKEKWKDATAFEKELIAYAKTCLPGFARPEWVEIVDGLEKTSTGKVSKVKLRESVKKLSKQ